MEERVHSLISEHFGMPVSEINPGMDLRKDFNATDLEVADFFLALEGVFNVAISSDEAARLHTVGDLILYISDHVEEIA